ncbi:negative regulator GrlR [Escherichia coli]|nr:negative regulator GrlR [Escherichia coli]
MIMKDGIYSIIFISNEDSCGEGILVKNGNMITGGDIASVYQGGSLKRRTSYFMSIDIITRFPRC